MKDIQNIVNRAWENVGDSTLPLAAQFQALLQYVVHGEPRSIEHLSDDEQAALIKGLWAKMAGLA